MNYFVDLLLKLDRDDMAILQDDVILMTWNVDEAIVLKRVFKNILTFVFS
jgi:hypothetical protein